MKKLIALCLAFTLCLGFASCAPGGGSNAGNGSSNTESGLETKIEGSLSDILDKICDGLDLPFWADAPVTDDMIGFDFFVFHFEQR